MNKTSDYIDFDKVLNKGKKLLNDNEKCRLGCYLITSICVGLRVSDVLMLKFKDLEGDKIILNETKTGKKRIITLNNHVKSAYSKLVSKLNEQGVKVNSDDYIFTSQKNTVYKTQSINVLLKKIFNNTNLQISSHSLRKSWAVRVWENNQKSDAALILISDILNHSNTAITRRYLGIRAQTIENVYLTL